MKRFMETLIVVVILSLSLPVGAEEKIEVFTTVRYDQYIIYESLAMFWVGIAGLLVIIRMKLKEIERVQKLSPDEPNIPSLE